MAAARELGAIGHPVEVQLVARGLRPARASEIECHLTGARRKGRVVKPAGCVGLQLRSG